MSQRQWVVIIGVWVVIFLFLGFPSSWEKVLAILTGLLIIFFAYRIKFKENPPANGSSFTDNVSAKPFSPEQASPSQAAPAASDHYSNSPAIPDAHQ